MSRQLVSRSPDLLRLQEEGYPISFRAGNLVLEVPYVNALRTVVRGLLVSSVTVAGDRTAMPDTHVVSFVGALPEDVPCDATGSELEFLINQRGPLVLGDEMVASCTFSHKPASGYPDYYEKMTTYAEMLLGYVHAIDPAAKLRTYPPVEADETESVFRYFDSATSRARIGAVAEKLRGLKIAIVGLGGSGSYVLDAVAKTPVTEVHLFDGDVLLTHNAFRAPGAASFEELVGQPMKVEHYQRKYDAMHRHVIAHPVDVTVDNVGELERFDFVFLTMDTGPDKQLVIEKLQSFGVPMVDTGMGVYQQGDALGGIVRTTASHDRLQQPRWINDNLSFTDEGDDEYDQNIQIAELNMLNAALAVIVWKKYFGFYLDFEHEASSNYTIDGNHLLNDGVFDED